jgi:transposase InsO family protein
MPPPPRVRYFHGCYSLGDDRLWGVNRRRKGAAITLAALKSIRAARPDGAPIYVVRDNLSAHKGADIRRWAKKHKVELCFIRWGRRPLESAAWATRRTCVTALVVSRALRPGTRRTGP